MAAPKKGNPRGSGYQRVDGDWYVEPPEAVHALLDAERFVGCLYDPACGSGTILQVARKRGFDVLGSDIAPRCDGVMQMDFRGTARPVSPIDNVVCNPPYKLAEEFIAKALTIARFKVAMLLPLKFLEGQRRALMYQGTPLARVHVFSWRVVIPPGGVQVKKKSGGFVAYAWLVWAQDHQGPPSLHWLTKPAAAPRETQAAA